MTIDGKGRDRKKKRKRQREGRERERERVEGGGGVHREYKKRDERSLNWQAPTRSKEINFVNRISDLNMVIAQFYF